MPKTNKAKIMEFLANDPTLEMMPDELEQQLNAELDKPADEIDAILVEEILKSFGAAEPDPQRMKADWSLVKKNLPKRQAGRRIPQAVMRFGAVAAALAVMMGFTLKDAGAFPWTFIQKILVPVAQTFGIVIDGQTDITPAATDAPVYSVSDAPTSLTAYASLEDVPTMHGGYVIRPRWLPEGFAFTSGSHFSSIDSEIYSLDFENGEAWFNLRIHIHTLDDAVYSHEFERTLEVPIEKTVGQHTVTFYTNAKDISQLAFWVHENAHYLLCGEISVEDITRFVEHME